MKDKAGPSSAPAKPNGIHAQPNDVPNVQMNGASKRKTSDTGSSQLTSKPHKKRIVYMDVSDEDEKTSPGKTNGVVTNGVSTSPSGKNNHHRRKSKARREGGNVKQLSLQEQRRQLPIAQGVYECLVNIQCH
jgi:hypothetical protein